MCLNYNFKQDLKTMSQEEVLKFLNKKKFGTANEIAEELNISSNATRISLNKLQQQNLIEKVIIKTSQKRRGYVWKIKNYKNLNKLKIYEYVESEIIETLEE